MKKEDLENIVNILSEERLKKAYGLMNEENIIDSLACKAWNLALCGTLYPILQIVEICLRNSINTAMQKNFQEVHWFKNAKVLHHSEIILVNQTICNLESMHKIVDENNLISELPFGFWTALLSKRYERIIWHPLIKKIFPRIPRSQRTRAFIYERFRQIRRLRNRIFHHQRIWHFEDLLVQKQNIIDAICWIEPAITDFLKSVDKFDAVYLNGLDYYRIKVLDILKD